MSSLEIQRLWNLPLDSLSQKASNTLQEQATDKSTTRNVQCNYRCIKRFNVTEGFDWNVAFLWTAERPHSIVFVLITSSLRHWTLRLAFLLCSSGTKRNFAFHMINSMSNKFKTCVFCCNAGHFFFLQMWRDFQIRLWKMISRFSQATKERHRLRTVYSKHMYRKSNSTRKHVENNSRLYQSYPSNDWMNITLWTELPSPRQDYFDMIINHVKNSHNLECCTLRWTISQKRSHCLINQNVNGERKSVSFGTFDKENDVIYPCAPNVSHQDSWNTNRTKSIHFHQNIWWSTLYNVKNELNRLSVHVPLLV